MKILLLLSLTFFSPLAFALEGNEGGHGGDPYALEFKTIAEQVGAKMAEEESSHPALFQKWKFHADSFRKTGAAVRVVSLEGEEVILNDQEVDAINYPTNNMIKLNRTRWREDDFTARVRLVTHELFGILGVERDSFPASIDFGDFLVRASQEILAEHPEGSFMASFFYGRCLSFPDLTDSDTCDSGSEKLAKAEACAVTQAEGKCRMSGKSHCSLMDKSFNAVLSATQVGVRYCEVLVIMK